MRLVHGIHNFVIPFLVIRNQQYVLKILEAVHWLPYVSDVEITEQTEQEHPPLLEVVVDWERHNAHQNKQHLVSYERDEADELQSVCVAYPFCQVVLNIAIDDILDFNLVLSNKFVAWPTQ